jgi:hypothetical protein
LLQQLRDPALSDSQSSGDAALAQVFEVVEYHRFALLIRQLLD